MESKLSTKWVSGKGLSRAYHSGRVQDPVLNSLVMAVTALEAMLKDLHRGNFDRRRNNNVSAHSFQVRHFLKNARVRAAEG